MVQTEEEFYQKKFLIDLFPETSQNQEFINNGFFTIPFLDDSEISHITDQLEALDLPDVDFYHSRGINKFEDQIRIDQLLKDFLTPKLDRFSLRHAYRIFTALYIKKNVSENTSLFLHTDDSLCDERNYMPCTLWIPLVDVNEQNGSMCIVPGSHLKTNVFRGRKIPDPFVDRNKTEIMKRARPLTMKKGHALVYHPSCAHFSPPNKSDQFRPVIACALLPEAAPSHLYYGLTSFGKTRKIGQFAMSADQFNNWDNNSKPGDQPSATFELQEK